MKSKMQLGLNLSDVFDIRQFNMEIAGSNFNSEAMRKRETRILTVSLTYRFGSNENPFSKKKPANSAPTENMEMGF